VGTYRAVCEPPRQFWQQQPHRFHGNPVAQSLQHARLASATQADDDLRVRVSCSHGLTAAMGVRTIFACCSPDKSRDLAIRDRC